MIKTWLQNELATDLWVGLNGGHITRDEYAEMMEVQQLPLPEDIASQIESVPSSEELDWEWHYMYD